MQIVCEYLPWQVLLSLLLLGKRFYISFLPPTFSPLEIYKPKLVRIKVNSANIEFFSQTRLFWQKIEVRLFPANENSESTALYYSQKDQSSYYTES
jgi:hypothetical protein